MESKRFGADIIRLQTTELLNIQLKKKDKIKPVELWEFPWDEEERDKPDTDEEIRRYNEEIIKKFARDK